MADTCDIYGWMTKRDEEVRAHIYHTMKACVGREGRCRLV